MATFDSKTIVMMAENGHSVEIDGKKIQLTIVQEAAQAKPDYSHLVGKFVKRIVNDGYKYTINKWYKTVHDKEYGIGIEDNWGNGSYCTHSGNGTKEEMQANFLAQFDISNPLDHNPDDARVFDVPSEIRISSDTSGLNLHFSEHQALWYNKSANCYAVASDGHIYNFIPCIATECKFEDLKEGDLFFATDKNEPDLRFLTNYYFLDKTKNFILVNGYSIRFTCRNYTHYFKITPKP